MHHRLLVVAHGTASPSGSHTTRALAVAIAAARPDVAVDLCFLDVAQPRLTDSLDDRPTIVLPLLLSTGYHVESDIPAAIAGHPASRAARHLGPHPRLTDVLVDRLRAQGAIESARCVLLVAAGSSRPGALGETHEAAGQLADRLHQQVLLATVGPELPALVARLPAPIAVATYLLAEGRFVDDVRNAVGTRGTVAAPLGVHPALVELAWARYDEALDATARRDTL